MRKDIFGWLAGLLLIVGVVMGLGSKAWGRVSYALDDPYIHLALAKNLAENGNWGLRPELFESASSSPLWTLVLAVSVWATPWLYIWPLFWATVFSALGLVGVSQLTSKWPTFARQGALGGSTIILALGAMIGMEHSLHAALTIAMLVGLQRTFEKGWVTPRREWIYFGTVAALLIGTRFEAAALVGLACLVLIYLRAWGAAVAVAAGGATSLGAFMAFNKISGGYFLPNSVVSKSGYHSIFNGQYPNDYYAVALMGLAIVVGIWACFARKKGLAVASFLLAGLGLAQLFGSLVALDSPYTVRYAIYVTVSLTVFLAYLIGHSRFALAALLIPVVVFLNYSHLFMNFERSIEEIQLQQRQTGLLAENLGEDVTLAVNDLGYPALLGKGPLVDMVGLGSQQVLDLREMGADWPTIATAMDVDLMAVYNTWWAGEPAFTPLERWCISGYLTSAAGSCVDFYLVNDRHEDKIRGALAEQRAKLPAAVTATVAKEIPGE